MTTRSSGLCNECNSLQNNKRLKEALKVVSLKPNFLLVNYVKHTKN
jgi:hypothetical protein